MAERFRIEMRMDRRDSWEDAKSVMRCNVVCGRFRVLGGLRFSRSSAAAQQRSLQCSAGFCRRVEKDRAKYRHVQVHFGIEMEEL